MLNRFPKALSVIFLGLAVGLLICLWLLKEAVPPTPRARPKTQAPSSRPQAPPATPVMDGGPKKNKDPVQPTAKQTPPAASPAASVESRVIVRLIEAASETPIAGASIHLAWLPGSEAALSADRDATKGLWRSSKKTKSKQGSTGPDGTAHFLIQTDAAEKEILVFAMASSAECTNRPERNFSFPSGASHTVELRAERGGKVRGKVRLDGAPEGEPLPEQLSVCCSPEYGGTVEIGTPMFGCTLDSKTGEYLSEILIPRRYFVWLVSGGEGMEFEQVSKYQLALVEAGKTVEGPTIVIRPYPTFTGVAQDAHGTFLTDREIKAIFENRWLDRGTASRSDETGKFQVKFPRHVTWVNLSIDGYLPLRLPPEAVKAALDQGGDLGTLLFHRGGRIWGRAVSDRDGTPLNNVHIRALPAGAQKTGWSSSENDALQTRTRETLQGDWEPRTKESPHGWFVIQNVPSGRIRLTAQATPGSASLDLTVTEDASIGPVELRLVSTGEVEGTLLWPNRRQGPSLAVGAYPVSEDKAVRSFPPPQTEGRLPNGATASARTDLEGNFRFASLPPGHYVFVSQIRHEGKSYRAVSEIVDLTFSGASAMGLRLEFAEVPE